MKKFLSVVIITLLPLGVLDAQFQKINPVNEGAFINHQTARKIYPIPGSYVLGPRWAKLRENLKGHEQELLAQSLKKTTSWNFQLGSPGPIQSGWWATNMVTDREYIVPSHCRAIGTNCYIFVEDTSWNSGIVTQAGVDSIRIAFEMRTPANPIKGIYQLDTQYFGSPPNVDSDPRIIILILDIKDGFTGSGGYMAGYFYEINEYADPFQGHRSNDAEIYYVDCNPGNLSTTDGIYDAASTTAHEFQHMIHFNYDRNEISFVNEGMSECASVLCGYSIDSPSDYFANTNVDFFYWHDSSGDPLPDYSRTAIFNWYLLEQFGSSIAKRIVQNTNVGESGYNSAFQSGGSSLRFTDMLKNFAVATMLNDTNYDSKYGFRISVNQKPVAGWTYYTPNVDTTRDVLQPYATRYISYVNGKNITTQFSSSSSIAIKAIATGSTSTKVDTVPVGQPYTLANFGTDYSTVIFAITNLSSNSTSAYSFQSSGTEVALNRELKYDLTEPTGYLGLPIGDTVCVWFHGITGAKLDSVRVALRHNGTMTGGIWKYSGAHMPSSPLGQKIAGPLTVSMSSQPSTFANNTYPSPWPYWASLDLRSYNIDASSSFAVAFICQGDYSTNPRVMITESPTPSEYTSVSYSTSNSRWLYWVPSDSQGTVYTFLIRAYVSTTPDGVQRQLELNPTSFALNQNFPNPFNPGTNFTFTLPSGGSVSLRLYDILGREVANIAEGIYQAGEHRIFWQPQHLAAGTYFYRLKTENGILAKKLIYLP